MAYSRDLAFMDCHGWLSWMTVMDDFLGWVLDYKVCVLDLVQLEDRSIIVLLEDTHFNCQLHTYTLTDIASP